MSDGDASCSRAARGHRTRNHPRPHPHPSASRHHVKLKVDGPVHETWTLGYLTDTIYLRDLWIHRIDAARAARQSTSPGLSAEVPPGCRLMSDGLRRRANAPRASVRTELGPAPARHRWRATGSPWRAFWTWSVAGY
jgi:hypothetical protein